MSSLSLRRSGIQARRSGWAILALALLLGCNYGFQGGGGFPAHVRTIYIEPFENLTPEFEIEQELFSALLEQLPDRLGVRLAGREVADALVTGRIVRVDDSAQNYRPDQASGATNVMSHQVRVTIAVQIVDTQRNVILWESSSASGTGEYSPMNQDISVGRREAIEELVTLIIDQAQSQW